MDIGQGKGIIFDAVREAGFGNTHPLDYLASILVKYEEVTGEKVRLEDKDRVKMDWENTNNKTP